MYCSFFTVPFTAIRFPGLLARKHHQSIRLFDSGDGVLRFENLSFLHQMKNEYPLKQSSFILP